MILDELVTKFGIDVDTEKLKAFVGSIGNAAKTIADKANQANAALQQVNDSAVAGAQQAGEQAQAAEKPLNRLRLLALGVTTVIGAATAKVLGFVVGAIGGARDLAKEKGLLYQISERELEQADDYSAALKRNQLAVDSLRTKIALNLTPALTRMANGFYHLLESNKDLITNGITKVIQVSGKVVQVFFNAWRALDRVVTSTIGWKNALLVLVAVLAVVKRATISAFIVNPVTWVIAAIAGLLLLLDDLMTYLDGGDAQFGEFWGACVKWIKQVKGWWDSLSGEMQASIKLIGSLLAVMFGTQVFRASTQGATLFLKALRLLLSPVRGLISVFRIAAQAAIFFGRALFANPIGLVIAAIAGLIYIGYDLYKWFNGGESVFGNWYQAIADTWKKVKAMFASGFKYILSLFGVNEKDADRYIDRLSNIYSKVWALLTWPFTAAFEYIKGLYSVFTDDSTTWVQKFEAIFGLLLDLLAAPFRAGWDLVKAIFGLADGDVEKFITDIGKSFSGVIDAIVKPFKTAFDEVKRYYDDTVGRISGAWDSVTEGASKAWNSTLDFVGLSDNTSSPQPANYASQTNSHATTVKGGDVKAEIHISATNTDDARRGVETGLDNANKRAMARLQGVAKG